MTAHVIKDVELEKHFSIAECKFVQLLQKSICQSLRKLGIDLLQGLAILHLSIHLKDFPFYLKDTCLTIFIVALFITARNCKQSRCPLTEKLIKKMWYTYIMDNILLFKKWHHEIYREANQNRKKNSS